MNGIIEIALRTKTSVNTIKIVRCVSLLRSNCKQDENIRGNFIPIYKFPYIIPFSIINRLKLYQTALTAVSLPVAICLNQLNHISSSAVQFTAALGKIYSLIQVTIKKYL